MRLALVALIIASTTLIAQDAKPADTTTAPSQQQLVQAVAEARDTVYQQSRAIIAKDRQIEQLTAQIQAIASAIDKAGKGLKPSADGHGFELVEKPKPAPTPEKLPAPKKDGGK